MNYNFHTHTYHCHHASGTPEEYVLRAIEGGITEMGFSDHFPFDFGDGTYNSARVPVDEVASYLEEVAYLKKKYADKITIHLGFEMEYYTELFPVMKAKALEYGAEYLLLGEHYYLPENIPGNDHCNSLTADAKRLTGYTDTVIEGMQTGAFTYVAHPDMFRFDVESNPALYEKEARRIAEASLSLGIPLEINFLGIRDSRNYPNPEFWRVVGEVGAPVVFGFDAHTVLSAFDGDSLQVAKKMVSDLKLNYIGKPKLRKLL